jgi:hypothetical protein
MNFMAPLRTFERVDRSGLDAHPHLAGLQSWQLVVLQPHLLGTAVAVILDSFHLRGGFLSVLRCVKTQIL